MGKFKAGDFVRYIDRCNRDRLGMKYIVLEYSKNSAEDEPTVWDVKDTRVVVAWDDFLELTNNLNDEPVKGMLVYVWGDDAKRRIRVAAGRSTSTHIGCYADGFQDETGGIEYYEYWVKVGDGIFPDEDLH